MVSSFWFSTDLHGSAWIPDSVFTHFSGYYQQAWMEKKQKQINKYQDAIRTNRQLAAVLQTRGLNENATYFAYRAQVLKQWILRQALLEKNVQRDLSVIFVILVVVLVFTLLGGLVWLQIVTSQSNFCPPFPSSY